MRKIAVPAEVSAGAAISRPTVDTIVTFVSVAAKH